MHEWMNLHQVRAVFADPQGYFFTCGGGEDYEQEFQYSDRMLWSDNTR